VVLLVFQNLCNDGDLALCSNCSEKYYQAVAINQTNVNDMCFNSYPIGWELLPLDIDISKNVEVCKANRNRFIEVLKGKVRFKNPEGGFYIFFDAGCNEIEFLNKAFNLGNIKLTHGSIFTNSVNHVRLSYCVSKEQAEEAAKSLKMITVAIKMIIAFALGEESTND
jgi:aspartate/methionine/tyrosine aminotransferase